MRVGSPSVERLGRRLVRLWLPARKPDSHKGNYGHALLIAGSRGMAGASVLCSYGALRGGGGLVTVAVPRSLAQTVARNVRPEAMILRLPEDRAKGLSPGSCAAVLDYVKKRKITSLAIGPGLSREKKAVEFVRKLLRSLEGRTPSIQGVVLDADGFLAMGSGPGAKDLLARLRLPVIVTPHPGEMARFLGTSTSAVQKDRIDCARKFAKLNRVVCVIKGHETVISDGKSTFVNSTGNPGMATGGSGDVLTGLISAIIPQVAQGTDRQEKRPYLLRAACAGVYIHGLAGDLARKDRTEIALIAGDIAEKISQAWKVTLKT